MNKTYEIERDDGKNLRFTGELIASMESQLGWPTVNIPSAPVVMSRQDALRTCPALEDIIIDAEQYCVGASVHPEAISIRLSMAELLTLLPCADLDSEGLLMLLPAQFENHIAGLALSIPDIENHLTTDLMGSTTYACWKHVSGECMEVQIPMPVVSNILDIRDFNPFNFEDADDHQTENIDDRAYLFVPIIIVAGNAVAAGGFPVSMNLLSLAQCSEFASGNYRPYRVFSEEELNAAASKADGEEEIEPWRLRSWQGEQGRRSVIEPMPLYQNNKILASTPYREPTKEPTNWTSFCDPVDEL